MRRSLGIALLALALAQLGYRGMQRIRHDVPLWDFASVHAAARTWIHGGDPYDLRTVVDTWGQGGIFTDRDVSYFATVYPPTSLVTLVPVALLPAREAMIAWLVLTLVLVALQFMALADMAQLHWRDPRLLLLVGGALASSAMQFGILSGQLSLPAISLCILAFWCAGRDRDRLAGVLLGLACAIKPQVAGPFVVYYLVLRRFKLSGFAILVGATIGVIALAAMYLSHIQWIEGWRQSIAVTTRVGGVNDYGWAGKYRDEIVDLKMLLVSFIPDPRTLTIAVWGIVAALFAWYVRSFPRRMHRGAHTEILALAGLSAIALLPVYHRVYDVTLLTLALAWGLAELDGVRRRPAIVVLALLSVFLIPFDVVGTVAKRMPALLAASKTGWWQSFLAPHYAWGLLALTIALIVALRHEAAGSSGVEAISSPSPREGRSLDRPH